MKDFDWKKFLRRWNDDVFASATVDEVPSDARAAKWLGVEAAGEKQIALVEDRLGIELPPTYRNFLAVSDGWKYVSHAVPTLWGVARIDWFRNNEPDWVEAWGKPTRHEPAPDDEYFAYHGNEQDYRPEHLRETLQIGPMGDVAFLLLNPQVIGRDGEWECWMIASWIPGVHRYRSFREMMELEHARLVGVDRKQKAGIINGLPHEFVGAPGTRERHKKQPVLSTDGPSVAQLLAALEDGQMGLRLFPKAKDSIDARGRVADALGSRRDPNAVPALIELLSDDEHRLVRRMAIRSLGEIAGKEAIDALFRELDQGDFFAAIHELKRLAPDRLKEPLLAELSKASWISFPGAAGILAELKEKRALPILVEILKKNSSAAQVARLAGRCIAMFDVDGLEMLRELLAGDDAVIRHLAVDAIGDIRRPQARETMRGLLNDPDPVIRERAEFWMGLLPGPR